MKKILSTIICICLAFSCCHTNVWASTPNNIEEIASACINVLTTECTEYINKTYTNIDHFVSNVKTFFPEIPEAEIGKFLIRYTGQGSADDLPTDILVETTTFSEITVQEEYLKVDSNGETMSVTRTEALRNSALAKAGISPISPRASWTSDDGYMKIQTSYSLSKTSGNKKYYVISAKANWLKHPAFVFKDVICIANTATYDDSYNDYAYYKQSISCGSSDSNIHCTEESMSEKYADGTGSGVTLLYPSVNGAGARVDLKQFVCDKGENPGIHNTKMNYMEAYIRYRIICTTGKSYNIQGAYSHAELGIGSIGLSISAKGASISFSFAGSKSDFFARPVTIDA